MLLCNLDAGWGSPSLGNLVSLDLNANATACDLSSPACELSVTLTSPFASLLCAAFPVDSEVKFGLSSRFHQQPRCTSSPRSSAALLKMGGA